MHKFCLSIDFVLRVGEEKSKRCAVLERELIWPIAIHEGDSIDCLWPDDPEWAEVELVVHHPADGVTTLFLREVLCSDEREFQENLDSAVNELGWHCIVDK